MVERVIQHAAQDLAWCHRIDVSVARADGHDSGCLMSRQALEVRTSLCIADLEVGERILWHWAEVERGERLQISETRKNCAVNIALARAGQRLRQRSIEIYQPVALYD